MRALLMIAATTASCATAISAPGAGESYRALGTEPFWSIALANGRMVYESPEGGFSVGAPAPRETGDGRIYETRRIILHVWHGACSDGMSDRIYTETVRAVVDGRTLNGCGGAWTGPE